jgi:RimJ/RimL family protein N-acetyltransferase
MKVIKSLGCGFYLAQLEIASSREVFNLRESIPDDKKKFVAAQTMKEIAENLSEPNYAVGGFDKDHHLVGTAFLIHQPQDLLFKGLNKAAIPDEIMNTDFSAAIITVMVDRKAQGCGLMKSMLQHLLSVAEEKGYKSIGARVVEGNEPPWSIFKRSGFEVVAKVMHQDHANRGLFIYNPAGNSSHQQARTPYELALA